MKNSLVFSSENKMEEEKQDASKEPKFDKYSRWLGIIENLAGDPNLGESQKNIYSVELLKRNDVTKENFYFPINLKSLSELEGFCEKEVKKIKFLLLLMMQEAGIILKVPQNTILTAQIIFNRFFWRVSLNSYEPFIITIACFYIASKIEESYRRIRDVISTFYKLFSKKVEAENQDSFIKKPVNSKERNIESKLNLGKNISQSTNKEKENSIQDKKYEFILDVCSENYKILKNNVCFYEIQIFKELGFSIYSLCDHPHKYLTYFIKHLKGTKELLQKSWNYLNDSYKTEIPLHFPPHVIACSAIFLAGRNFKLPLPQVAWWEIYETKIDEIQEIISILLSLNETFSVDDKCNLKINEIREILYKKSQLKNFYENQEKLKDELLTKEKIMEKTKGSKKPIVKYEYGNQKRKYSRSRSRSKEKYYRHHQRKKSSSTSSKYKNKYKKHHRRNSYSSSDSEDSYKKSNNEDERNYSESSSSVEPEKIKERINRIEREKKKRENLKKRKSRYRKYSNSSSSESNSRYKRQKGHRKTKKKSRSSSSSSSSSSGSVSDSSSSS